MSILVLDIGTTSMRGILYEKNGEKIALSRRDNHLVFLGDSLIEDALGLGAAAVTVLDGGTFDLNVTTNTENRALMTHNKTFRISIGQPIPWQTFTDKSKTAQEWAQWLRTTCVV